MPDGQVWAAGAGNRETTVLRYSGHTWSSVPGAPKAKSPTVALAGDGDGHGGVWLAMTISPSHASFVHWNGHKWTTVQGPPYRGSVSITDMALIPGTQSVWAVGWYSTLTKDTQLIDVYGTLRR